MKLHELRPAKGATHKEKDLAVVKLPVKVELLQKVIKVDRAVPVIKVKWRMKVDRCRFSAGFQNVDLRILIVLNIKYSIWARLNNSLKNMKLKKFHLKIFISMD